MDHSKARGSGNQAQFVQGFVNVVVGLVIRVAPAHFKEGRFDKLNGSHALAAINGRRLFKELKRGFEMRRFIVVALRRAAGIQGLVQLVSSLNDQRIGFRKGWRRKA